MSAEMTNGRLYQKQGLFQRLYDLTDLDARPAPVSEGQESRPAHDVLEADDKRKRERFIPVTRFALLDRLTLPYLWPAGQAADARRFFRYLDYWRQQQYFALLLDLEQTYETFSPDSDLLMTRNFSDDDRDVLKHRVFEGVESLLQRANYERIDPTDVEMIFPNTEVRFRSLDKLRLGVTAGGGLGMGAFGAAGKIALLASNPIAAAGALAGLGGIAARQAMGFFNQKQRYMVVMAQNLYFHTMADNRGVILKIAARGAEEDLKEEMLLYSVLAKEKATRADLPSIDLAIESYLTR
ncbi:MAG: DUF3754 domain-containing protein, partial [Hyphomicrobium denitrificans]|nr:DUF3754 domain-containing protein [Hyphomicrobium denitrificans]